MKTLIYSFAKTLLCLVPIGLMVLSSQVAAQSKPPAPVTEVSSQNPRQLGGELQFIPTPEDPCRPLVVPIFGWQPEVDHINVSGGGIDIYRIASVPSPVAEKRARPLVLIVNGNGFDLGDYDLLATHLASKGFLVAVAKRPVGENPESFTLDAAQAILGHTEQFDSTRIALVGHSVGGNVAVKAAMLNKKEGIGLNIDAVVGIAPVANVTDTPLTIEHVPAYLLIYGSQDQDVDGLSNVANDAFAAFDIAGTESSTTCATDSVCTATPNLDKTMVYVHGATHGGLINKLALCQVGTCTDDFNEFLAPVDQFCVTKGYTDPERPVYGHFYES